MAQRGDDGSASRARHHAARVLRGTALEGDKSQGEIAVACDLDKTTMVVTIDQLERDEGTAVPSPGDAARG
jgi:hypothetical protein